MSDVSQSGFGGSMDFDNRDNATMGSGSGETAQDAVSRAGAMASDLRHRAMDQVETRISDQKYRAAETLESVAQSLRTASHQMPQAEGIGRYMERAASQVDNLASFLNNHDVAELFDEVEEFARRQPAVFVGGAFALGVLGARFLKSSRRNLGDTDGHGTWSRTRMDELQYDGHDSVSRPNAPGYAPPADRETTGFTAGAPGGAGPLGMGASGARTGAGDLSRRGLTGTGSMDAGAGTGSTGGMGAPGPTTSSGMSGSTGPTPGSVTSPGSSRSVSGGTGHGGAGERTDGDDFDPGAANRL